MTSVSSCAGHMTGYQHCGRGVLNLCMPYSSQDEIATAVEEIVRDALVEGKTE
jgi:undecaprenyl pyrophosphate synthase